MHYKKLKRQRPNTVTTNTNTTATFIDTTDTTYTDTATTIISTPTTITSTTINTDNRRNIENMDNLKQHYSEPVGSNNDTNIHDKNSTSNDIIQIKDNIIATNNKNTITNESGRNSNSLYNPNTNTEDNKIKDIQKRNKVGKNHGESSLIPGTIIINSSPYEKNLNSTTKSKARKIKHKEQINLKEREINDLANKKGRKMRKNYTLPPKPSKNDNGYKLDIRKYKAAKEYLSHENTTSLKEVSKKYKISVPTLITYMDSERVKEFIKTGKYSASSALRAKRNCKNQYNEHSKREARKRNYLLLKNQQYELKTPNNEANNTYSQEYNKNKTFDSTSTEDDDGPDNGDISEDDSQYYDGNYGDDDGDNGDSENHNDNNKDNEDNGEYNRLRINRTTVNDDDNYNTMSNLPNENKHIMQTTKSASHSNLTSSALSTINSRGSLLSENIETYDTPIFPNNEQYHLSEEEEQENQNRYRVETFRRKSTNGLNTDEKVTSIKKIISDMQFKSSFGAETGAVPTSRSKSLDTGSLHSRVQDLAPSSKRNSESNIEISRSMNPFHTQIFHKNITVETIKDQSNAHAQEKDQYENTSKMKKPIYSVPDNDTEFKQSQPKNSYQAPTYNSNNKDEVKFAQGHTHGRLVNANSSNKKLDEMTTKTKNYSLADNENVTGGQYPPGSEHGYIKPTDFFPFNSDNVSKSYYNSAFSRGNAINTFAPSPMNTYQQASSYHPQAALYHFAQQQMLWPKVSNYPNYPNIVQQSMPYFDIFQNQLSMAQLQNNNSGPDNSLQQQSISSPLAAGNYVPVLSSGPGQAAYRDQKTAAQDWECQSQIIRPHPNNNHFYFPSHYEMKSPPPGPAVSASGPSGYQNHIQQTVASTEFGEQAFRKNIGTIGSNIDFLPNASKVSREKINLADINKSHSHNELEADSDFQNKYNLLFEEFQKKFKDLLDGRSEDLQIFYAKHMEQKMNSLFYPYSIESMLRSRENPRLTSKPNSRDSMLEYVPVFQQPSTTVSGYNTYNISEEANQPTSFTTTASASGAKSARPLSTDADKLSKLFSTNGTGVENLKSSSKKKNKKVPSALNLKQTAQKFSQQVSAPFLSPPNTTLTAKNQDRSALKFDGSSQNTEINEELYKSDFENEDKHLHGSDSNTYTHHGT